MMFMGRRSLSLSLILTLGVLPASAGAQTEELSDPRPAPTASAPASARAARAVSVTRRVLDSGPRTAPLTAGVGSGYGYTESVLGQQDRHHRLLGSLLLEGAPLGWLGLGLRLDGRYDRHGFDQGPADDGWVGEPRLYARADRALSSTLSGGVRATLFFPGAQAPSWTPGATSTDLLALITHADQRVKVSGNAGYRLDRSARSAMDPSQYMPGDRLALGVSDFDAVLLGAAASYDVGDWQLFGEWSWEALVGSGAPSASRWPMRLGAGGRTPVSRSMDLEVMLEASPSGRPSMAAADPLVPVPPRLAVMAGLLVPLGSQEARPLPAPPVDRPMTTAPAPVPSVSVNLTAAGMLPADATVVLERPGDNRTFADDGEGQFTLSDVAPGPGTVVVRAAGHEDSRTPVQLRSGEPAAVEVALIRKLPSGQIRGTVRSFQGRSVAATVQVTADGGQGEPVPELRSEGGRFQLDVPPGRYQVLIEAPGHAPQTRSVVVEKNGVTVLNVDLRPGR
jgi:hypothetical protein